MLPLLVALLLAPPPFAFHRGQKVYLVGLDIAGKDTAAWTADLEVEQKAADQFRIEKAFQLVSSPQSADFVFLVAYDPRSKDHTEAGIALSPADYAKKAQTLSQLEAESLWFQLNRGRGRLPFLPDYSSARGLVRRFCRSVPRR